MRHCRICNQKLKIRFALATNPQTKENFAVWACADCNFAETVPQPDDLAKYYAGYYGKRHGFTNDYCAWRRRRWVEKSYRKRKGRIETDSQLQNKSAVSAERPVGNKSANGSSSKAHDLLILDIGCGDGTFLRKMQKRGWRTVGTELNHETLNNSDQEIYDDLTKVKEKFGFGAFDAITMWHTLEHFRNPRKVLKDVFQLLAPEGVLLIAVPDARGLQATIFGRFWLHLDVPRHLFHFDFNSLKLLLEQNGFGIKRHWHQEFEYDLLGWSQSALNTIYRRNPNVFFRMLAGQETRVDWFIKATNFLFGLVLSAIFLPFVWFGTFARRGGTLVVCATKTFPTADAAR